MRDVNQTGGFRNLPAGFGKVLDGNFYIVFSSVFSIFLDFQRNMLRVGLRIFLKDPSGGELSDWSKFVANRCPHFCNSDHVASSLLQHKSCCKNICNKGSAADIFLQHMSCYRYIFFVIEVLLHFFLRLSFFLQQKCCRGRNFGNTGDVAEKN